MVKVGEKSGRLPDVLHDLAEMTKWHDELVARVKKVMMYPAFVSVVLFFVLLFIMTYLVPNLVTFVKSTGQELPLHTLALLATSDFFINYWYLVIVIPVVIPIAIGYGRRSSRRFRRETDKFLLNFWLVGPVVYRYKLARFANYAAMMYASGITVLDSLGLCRDIVDNLVLDEAIERVRMQISDGESISNSFALAGMFPPLVTRMMRVGEGSGELDKAFMQVSYFYSREAQEAIGRLEQFIGPALIMFVGGLMLWVILSVIEPIYDAVLTVGAGL
jgi:type IV pilus assembly protein PilC